MRCSRHIKDTLFGQPGLALLTFKGLFMIGIEEFHGFQDTALWLLGRGMGFFRG